MHDARIQQDIAHTWNAMAGLPGWAPDVGKHGRDMVFVNAPRRNLAAYLDRRRRKTAACAACEHAVACAGFYEPPDA